jgi:20S proteasome alpha/beta subunit
MTTRRKHGILKPVKLVKRRRKTSVTVCIAAIYQNNQIIGISDRMITTGDIEFEPKNSKIISLTNSIVVMTAGDGNLHEQILTVARTYVTKRISAKKNDWIAVADIANLYRDTYIKIKKDTIERDILSRYGLTYDSYTSRQKQLSDKVLDEISDAFDNFDLPDVETIVAGIDDTGAHIFTVMNNETNFDDSVGFTAIGIGYWHADSHFMLSDYSKSDLEDKALATIHAAKKKAEVSPGVGKDSDLFIIGPGKGSLTIFQPTPELDLMTDIDKLYGNYKKQVEKIDRLYVGKMRTYLVGVSQRAQQPQEANPSAIEAKIADEVKVSDKVEVKHERKEPSTRKGRKTT